ETGGILSHGSVSGTKIRRLSPDLRRARPLEGLPLRRMEPGKSFMERRICREKPCCFRNSIIQRFSSCSVIVYNIIRSIESPKSDKILQLPLSYHKIG